MSLHEYSVVGRHVPTEVNPTPEVFRMRLFAKDEVAAKSRFWFFLAKLKKVKRANGELLGCSVIHERNPYVVKNFGIFLRYNSRSGIHNMHKEYRDTTRVGAVQQMYGEMAARHRAQRHNIQIVEVNEMKSEAMLRTDPWQFSQPGVKFPMSDKLPRQSDKKHRRTFQHGRPVKFCA